MNSFCAKPCLSSRFTNWTSKPIEQFVHAWPGSLHRKQMSAVMSFGCEGANTLKAGGAALKGPKALATGGRSHKTVVGNMAMHGRGHRSMPPMLKNVCTGGAKHNEVQKASLVMQFSSCRMAALYHCFGESLEGWPDVRQATLGPSG
jgi:hypothetical protein